MQIQFETGSVLINRAQQATVYFTANGPKKKAIIKV
jgi:hypothetical protein